MHVCPYCNAQLDRDYNASLNIKKEGMSLWLEGMEHAGLPVEQIVTTVGNIRLHTVSREAGSPVPLGRGSSLELFHTDRR